MLILVFIRLIILLLQNVHRYDGIFSYGYKIWAALGDGDEASLVCSWCNVREPTMLIVITHFTVRCYLSF